MALYLFGIGGTGARVMKAFTMLLASGAKVDNAEAVIPILIDPDTANGDLTRTLAILKHYQSIQRATSAQDGFFGTPIKSLNELGEDGGSTDQFRFEIEGVKGHQFGEFIRFAEMSRANQALTSLLYSDANLKSDMAVGFKGNPHIGSVVLNKMRESDLFRKFATAVNEHDRVFVISSIFGGTGAAGFPLLVKNIRNGDSNTPNHHRLQNMPIGAVTILPYFDVDNGNGQTVIDSNSFIAKTKAALRYYAKNLTGESDPRLNALYYIGDKVSNTQAGADGAAQQKNKAHFIELAAAMAIIDFMRTPAHELTAVKGIAQSPRYFEYGLKGETSRITFGDFGQKSHELIAHPLTRYYLFLKFYRDHYAESEHAKWVKELKLQMAELDARFRDDLQRFNQFYDEWLAEMESSEVRFAPLKRSVDKKDILKMVENYEDKTKKMPWSTVGVEKYNDALSSKSPSITNGGSAASKVLSLFHKTTGDLIAERIKL